MREFTGTSWEFGDRILSRQILKGQVWAVFPEYVVQDTGDRLVTFIQTGSQMGFPATSGIEVHPWKVRGYTHWTGHGSLEIARQDEPWAVSVFWSGPDRSFERWYVDLQAPFRRFQGGVDGLDHELDLEVYPDGRIEDKDIDLFAQRVAEGRYSETEAVGIRQSFQQIRSILETSGVPVEPEWAHWEPPADWGPLALPDGWDQIPPTDWSC